MNSRSLIIVLILSSRLANAQVTLSDLGSAKHAMQLHDYASAAKYGLLAWQEKPTVYVAYLLAYAYNQQKDYRDSRHFACLGLHTPELATGETLNKTQTGQMNYFFTYEPEAPAPNQVVQSGSITKEKTSFGLSVGDKSPKGDVGTNSSKPKTGKQNEVDFPKNILPVNASLATQIFSQFGKPPPTYIVDWTDSSFSFKDNSGQMKYRDCTTHYDSLAYPDLFSKRELLVPQMIPVYLSFRQGKLDANDSLVKQYQLNKYNLDAFIKIIFPEIYARRNDLPAFLKEFDWESRPATDNH
jgi:hypothetical protein